MSFLEELKRRNVFKVAAAYLIVGWLIMQAGDTLAPALHLPEWINSALAFFLILGFPLALFFAWAFEMTPEGLKKEKDIDRSQSITSQTGQKLNYTIIVLLVVTLAYFAWDKFEGGSGSISAPGSEVATNVAEQKMNPTPVEHSIAVLPFVNMSSDPEQEYFSDGLSEELLNLLAKVPELSVAARTSSFSFKGQHLEIPEIAERLHVNHVLEGSVRKSGNQIRITAQLVRADNGFHLWSETYDRQLDNIFQIQDEIAAAVVDALKITLLGEAPKARETDPEAYQLFLEGQYLRRTLTQTSVPKAIELQKKAVEIDPDYAPAWAELSYTYLWYAGTGGMPIDAASTLAEQAVNHALNADPGYGWAYFARGALRIFNKFDFKAGVEDYQHALRLDPGNAFLIAAAGTAARVLGRFDEATSQYEKALVLDPVMPETNSFFGVVSLYAGNLDQAEDHFKKSLSISPDIVGGHYRVSRVLLRRGELGAALAEAELGTGLVYRNTGLAMVNHALGKKEASQAALDTLIENAADNAAFQIAEVYAFRGETDKAFEWLNRAYDIRDSGIASTLGDPAFESLLSDPRWEQFLMKIGLADAWRQMPTAWGGPPG